MGSPRKIKPSASFVARLTAALGGYIDLFFRSICVLLGLMASDFVRFTDESPKPATNSSDVQTANMQPPLAPPTFIQQQRLTNIQEPAIRIR